VFKLRGGAGKQAVRAPLRAVPVQPGKPKLRIAA